MKISSSSPHAKLAALSTARESRAQASSSQPAAGQAVDLSDTARQLSALSSGAHDVDMQKVQAIRDAIASGQLKIDTSRIADSLLASARELLK
ncbi:flagellar biosynthesis anti-sigma factor FlgM [Pusillimonas sp. CC-YST705]|uniref:Negative regulator of flagellin synthesis n=1 Tax=Mesopusillimonas faecipullorum TaxID=2755040 RepID=A0ABS8C9V1_9BURK|nr:flagellar biosynthesis anti-sigma factor FlgM [Mesopusillimonas faecipullorum]MCB5362811.1 flagellar biosynthesis anti-sigma factor FlgM [Mesopusillimonas faecipullorum]